MIIIIVFLVIVAVSTLVGALVTRRSAFGVLFLLSAGALVWLALGTSVWVFIFFILAAIFAALEGGKRIPLWGVLSVLCVGVATLLVFTTANLAEGFVGQASASAHKEAAKDAAKAAKDGSKFRATKKMHRNPAVSLTVKSGELLPADAKCTSDVFSDNSLKSVNKHGRRYSDSVSTPFVAKTRGAQLTELVSEICVNPTLGDVYAQAFAAAPKIGSFSIYRANPWLSTFMTKTAKSPNGLNIWLTHKAKDGKTIKHANGTPVIYVTKDYRQYASMVNTLLLELDNQGVKTARSTTNWPSASLKAGTLPRAFEVTDPNMQESRPFLALTYTTKASESCPFVLGVNTLDKRPEFVACTEAKKIAPVAPTHRSVTKRPMAHRSTQQPVTHKSVTHRSTHTSTQRPVTHRSAHKSAQQLAQQPVTHKSVTHRSTHTSTQRPVTHRSAHKPTQQPTHKPTHKSTAPQVCTWTNGSVHQLHHGLCPKAPAAIPTNAHHTPAGPPSGSAERHSVHAAHKANPAVRPGSASTQKAQGATTAPQQTAIASSAGAGNDSSSPATGCKNTVTGESC